MTQKTQFTMVKEPISINVQPSALATYLAAGYTVSAVKYSEGDEYVDSNTQFLLKLGQASMYVKADDLQTYVAAGWSISNMRYGSGQTSIEDVTISYLDIPAFVSAEVGTVAATKVVVVFSTGITASDYATGVIIKVNTVSKTISASALQSDGVTVHYTIPAVTNGQTVTWEYSDATGLIRSAADGSVLDSISAQEVTNNVPA